MAHCVAFLQDRHTVEASQWAEKFWRTFLNFRFDAQIRTSLTFFAFSKPSSKNFAFWLKFPRLWVIELFWDFCFDMLNLLFYKAPAFSASKMPQNQGDHCVFLWQWLQDHKSFREKRQKIGGELFFPQYPPWRQLLVLNQVDISKRSGLFITPPIFQVCWRELKRRNHFWEWS